MRRLTPTAFAAGLFAGLVLLVALGSTPDSGRSQNVTGKQSDATLVDTNTTAYRSAEAPFNGGESLDLSAQTAAKMVLCKGFSTVSLGGAFSTASATVSVSAHLFYEASDGTLTYRSTETLTLTGGATDTSDGTLYPSTQTFDITNRGATHVMFTFRDPSAGTFTPTPVAVW